MSLFSSVYYNKIKFLYFAETVDWRGVYLLPPSFSTTEDMNNVHANAIKFI